MTDEAPAVARLRRERDLFQRLLALGRERALSEALRGALRSIVEATGAALGYLELRGGATTATEELPAWSASPECDEAGLARIRGRISRSIVADALAKGAVLHVPSAKLDDRFRDKTSVLGQGIEAVLCAPIGTNGRAGVLYLQGKEGAGPFSEPDEVVVREFALHVEPVLARLLREELERRRVDPTAPWRQKLDARALVGRSQALARILEAVDLIAAREVTALLTGESGTGKSCLARLIHDNSHRRHGPFVAVNCATVPEALLVSEFFGARKGSHSAALEHQTGKVAAAAGGTLFLDEVAELSLGCQAGLLQLLEEGVFYPLGSAAAQRADLRVIAATNADLQELIRKGEFREDLYYRLDQFRIDVPALRARRDDVPLLANELCKALAAELRLRAVLPSAESLAHLEGHAWPGNIRELRRTLREGLLRADRDGAPAIEPRHLFPGAQEATDGDEGRTLQGATRRFRRQLLRQALEECQGNVSRAAERLDVSRQHLHSLLGELGLR